MLTRKAHAVWEGNLQRGKGKMKLGSNLFEGSYSFSSRFENESGTNPEELIGAALAGCLSMAFSNDLDKAGFTPRHIETDAQVFFERGEEGFRITRIDLNTKARVDGIDEKTFLQQAEKSKMGCPVSNALKVEIRLNARLLK
jgi:osmotically inducible protein OsmC